MVSSIAGMTMKRIKPTQGWFCVWGVVAIQIEGRTRGLVDVEDRLMLVMAWDEKDARRRLRAQWKAYAQPYMNPHGYMVRWKLMEIREVYAPWVDEIDPRGTEIYSRIRSIRMKPAHRWIVRTA